MPVVADEPKLAKLVHEMADAGSGGADHLRLSPTAMHAEIARDWNTIFGALKSDMDPKRQFARNNVLVLYCWHEAATKPLRQAVEYSKLEMFRSAPICGCVESFLLC